MNRRATFEPAHDPAPIAYQLRNYVHQLRNDGNPYSRHLAITAIMAVALFAFEIFNFDTTRYALTSLIGDVRFAGFTWASILAIAFCSIDFAGLIRLFSPGGEPSREEWQLMGAWLLGATMNAVMTWWAVSLTLLNHDFGNEVLSRETLLRVVPIFVAVLVWLTRILFIGALTYSGERLLAGRREPGDRAPRPSAQQVPVRAAALIKERRPGDPPSQRAARPVSPQRDTLLVAQPQRQPAAQDTVVRQMPLATPAAKPANEPQKSAQRRPSGGFKRPQPNAGRPQRGGGNLQAKSSRS